MVLPGGLSKKGLAKVMELLFILQAAGFAGFLIMLFVFLIVIAVAYWLIATLLPEPLRKFGIAVIVVLAAIMLIYLLLSLTGNTPHFFTR